MSFVKDTVQQDLLEKFFDFVRAEEFEACFHWAQKKLQKNNSSICDWLNDIDQQPDLSSVQLLTLEPNNKLLVFFACYGFARHEVEESNWYYHAESLVKTGINVLETMPESTLNSILQKFAAIQIDICQIDRGIYTSQEWLMTKAANKIKTSIEYVNQTSNKLDEQERLLFKEHLSDEFNAYQHYSNGIHVVAELYAIRWGAVEKLTQQMQYLRPAFDEAVASLTQADKYIMSTDLESLWPPLTFFKENRPAKSGQLIVERGAIHISYFATVNHNISHELRQCLSDIVEKRPQDHQLHLTNWGASAPERNMLNDIWAGIAKDFEDIYSWQLPEITLPFRNRDNTDKSLNFDIELIYYPMGIFALSLKAPLDNLSSSGVRHAMSLGTPFAMDQMMLWQNESVNLLEEFAQQRFSDLAEMLASYFKHPVNDTLMFNAIENRYVTTVLDRVIENIDGVHSPINAKSLKAHFAYPAFVLPQRELRSAVDDWCLRNKVAESLNINEACFNKNEFVFANQHECVLGLLQQPNWVLEQFSEMLDVAAAINNLFHLTNKLLDKQLSHSLDDVLSKHNNKKVSAAELRKEVEKLTNEAECLNRFSHDAHWLLSLIDAGSMMTFPDHTKMVQNIFHHMGFEKLHHRTQTMLDKIQHRQSQIISETTKLYKKIQTRNSKRFTSIVSGVMALVSVGALKDIFDIVNAGELGVTISGSLQVSIITFFGVLLAMVLINQSNNEK